MGGGNSKRKSSSGSDNSAVRNKKARVVSVTVKTGSAHEKASVAKISKDFLITKEEAKGVFDLAKDLQPDDPAIFITFKSGTQVRKGLQRGGKRVAAHRPCAIGASSAAALTNIKNWVTGLAAAPVTVTPVGERGLALGNMDINTYGAIASRLSFTPNHQNGPNPWAGVVSASGVSLGTGITVFGDGVGRATLMPLGSNVFFG